MYANNGGMITNSIPFKFKMTTRLRSLAKECIFIITCLNGLDLLILPIACRGRCIYSSYFGLEKQETEKHVEVRQKQEAMQASEYVRGLNATSSLEYYDKRLAHELCVLIAVITVAGNRSSYLKQTIASIDAQIKANEAANIAVLVCDASSENSVYPEAEELRQYISVLKIYGKNGTVEPPWKQVRVKEKLDYVQCLQEITKTYPKAKTLLVLQDDVVAVGGGLTKLTLLLKFKLLKQNDWILAKLFYPDQYKGFDLTMRSTLELLWMILFSSAILFFIFVNIFWRNRFQSENILILLLITAVVSIVVVKLGRQLLTLRVMRFLLPYNYLPSEGSAACAILYPTARMFEVIMYLSSVQSMEDFPIDLALSAFSEKETHFRSFRVEEEFFKHVGYYSSLHDSHKRALDYYTP